LTESSPPEYVTLAKIFKPRGNRGEAAARDLCDDPDRFEDGTEVSLLYTNERREKKKIEHSWYHQGRLILKFAGVESISDAEELRGCQVQIPYVDLGPAPEGEHYDVDLVGCEVIVAESGRVVGTVEGLLEPGGQTLLEVRQGKKEILIPYTPEICVSSDVEARRITVRLPEGLEELND
jgi:16S rRNA processing protein RimM